MPFCMELLLLGELCHGMPVNCHDPNQIRAKDDCEEVDERLWWAQGTHQYHLLAQQYCLDIPYQHVWHETCDASVCLGVVTIDREWLPTSEFHLRRKSFYIHYWLQCTESFSPNDLHVLLFFVLSASHILMEQYAKVIRLSYSTSWRNLLRLTHQNKLMQLS